ncbi:unnamed protein product [Tilletia controversa]|uniref:CAF17 C-terminal domain-containing protein n=1 Tax=Tilletia controversa TaxID=13291 RepID=A0A8X7STU8_9BASI|nr:hypothetical protein A4X06_0g7751 [Tilletia controversa]CAD6897740.1 unnamed protein product [Tilletia controversa]
MSAGRTAAMAASTSVARAACSRSSSLLCSYRAHRVSAPSPVPASLFSTSSARSSPSSFTLAPVPNRSIIEIAGRDTLKLLQGLITTSSAHLANPPRSVREESALAPVHHDALYAGFLYPNGRLLADTLLYAVPSASSPTPSDTVLIEVDTRTADSLLAFLKKFKLRSKVTLRTTSQDEWKVWQVWSGTPNALTPLPEGGVSRNPSSEIVQALEALVGRQAHVRRDPRSAYLGYRAVLPGGTDAASILGGTADADAYLIHRILQGIPEGHDDIIDGSSLPLEANMDRNAGVDFKKGCYVGQELTARTHHTGVVRKRVVPVSLYAPDQRPPSDLALDASFATLPATANLDVRSSSSPTSPTRRARSAGKLLGSSIHNLALGLLRLDQVERVSLEAERDDGSRMTAVGLGEDGAESEVGVRPFLPVSWDPRVVESVRLASP